jgi:hypothetical protein
MTQPRSRARGRGAVGASQTWRLRGLSLTVYQHGVKFAELTCGGPVAQLAARLDGIEEVGGSNPPGSTKFSKAFLVGRLLPVGAEG